MKKKFLLLSVSLSALAYPAISQEAFNSLSFGLEAGTTGIGAELALPLVTDHLVLAVGFNAPSLSYPLSRELPVDAANAAIGEMNAQLESLGAAERVSALPVAELTLRPVLNLSTAKLMLEYYPFRKSSFHLTAGAYFGMGDGFVSASVSTDRAFWSAFSAVRNEISGLNEKYGDNPGYEAMDLGWPSFSLGNRTFSLHEEEGAGYSDLSLQVAKVRPYVGLGFGRSVPAGHLGFQFDVGIWYHGVPRLSSQGEVEYDPEAVSLLKDISVLDSLVFYPQVSLRLIYRIF